MDTLVEITSLSRRFGSRRALDNVTLEIPRGRVFGLIGENGAGKTTLLKHILGLYRAQEGSVRVFGLDPVQSPAKVLADIGYLSEDRAIPGWMSVQQVLRYTAAFYPRWDDVLATEMREMFALPPNAIVGTLSRGQMARLGLLLACAHRPPLLILDEPSSGLDPIVRQDILSQIIRTITDEGRTVIFSSHLLDEVQRVADQFLMLHAGRNVLSADINDAMQSHQKWTVRFAKPMDARQIPGLLHAKGHGRDWTLYCNGQKSQVQTSLRELGGEILEQGPLTLEEIFVARTAEESRS